MFADQFAALVEAGFTVSVFGDAVIESGRPIRNTPSGETVVYRGWMLNEPRYRRLVDAVAAAGGKLITSPEQYLAAHHPPNWYPLISDYTAETRVLPLTADFETELRAIGWDAYFVKDYVKSVKTSLGSIISDPSQIGSKIAEMNRLRGEIEGGLCVRRVERYRPDSERRFFVIGRKPFAPKGQNVPEIVPLVADRLDLPFYSIDVAVRDDGVPRVIEIGDGQVSDLVGWTAKEFAAVWR